MNKINLYKQRPSKNRVSILASLAVLASSLILPLQQAVAASLTPLANFNGTNGANPRAGIFQGKDLNLYGTTSQGGSSFNNGTAFKLTSPSFTTLTTLFSFTGTAPSNKGTNPVARLFQASDGNFYGVTSTGGANNIGTLFKLPSPYTTPTTLVDFSGIIGPSLGSNPEGRLIADSTGNVLWGTTSTGGVNDLGTIFKIPTTGSNSTPTTVITFNGTNGANPSARLLLGSDGNYYGTASAGGASNRGVVFKLTPVGVLTFSSFNGANGENPQSGLVELNGYLYGTTSAGGGTNNQGVVFKIPLGFSGTSPILVASFNGTNGANPTAALTPTATPGIFYGTASAGGANGTGVIYQLNTTVTPPTITPLISFNALASGGITNATGARPQSTLIKVGNDYYGTASGGGTSGRGNVFKFTP